MYSTREMICVYILVKIHDEKCRERPKFRGKEKQKRMCPSMCPCALYEGVWGWRYRSINSYNSAKEVCGEDDIKMCLRETGCVDADWIQEAQGKVNRRLL